jgi:hypothetical protein
MIALFLPISLALNGTECTQVIREVKDSYGVADGVTIPSLEKLQNSHLGYIQFMRSIGEVLPRESECLNSFSEFLSAVHHKHDEAIVEFDSGISFERAKKMLIIKLGTVGVTSLNVTAEEIAIFQALKSVVKKICDPAFTKLKLTTSVWKALKYFIRNFFGDPDFEKFDFIQLFMTLPSKETFLRSLALIELRRRYGHFGFEVFESIVNEKNQSDSDDDSVPAFLVNYGDLKEIEQFCSNFEKISEEGLRHLALYALIEKVLNKFNPEDSLSLLTSREMEQGFSELNGMPIFSSNDESLTVNLMRIRENSPKSLEESVQKGLILQMDWLLRADKTHKGVKQLALICSDAKTESKCFSKLTEYIQKYHPTWTCDEKNFDEIVRSLGVAIITEFPKFNKFTFYWWKFTKYIKTRILRY